MDGTHDRDRIARPPAPPHGPRTLPYNDLLPPSLESARPGARSASFRQARRVIAPLAALGVFAVAAMFWRHDALPYLLDYSARSYRRYWQVRHGLIPHIIGGSIALFTGPFQLWSGLALRQRRIHRALGYVYAGAVVLSALASFYVVPQTQPNFGLALVVLAAAWCASIGMALVAARNRRIDVHREWMMRSYIITFAFVAYRSLVKWSVLAPLGDGRAATALWVSWVIPMMVYELAVQWNRVKPLRQRTPAPASPLT
jgi:uncharacterized membrane protein